MNDLKVVTLDVANVNDIPGMARQFADNVEAGKYDDIKTVFTVIVDSDGFIDTETWGHNVSCFEAVGMFECAKRVMLDD